MRRFVHVLLGLVLLVILLGQAVALIHMAFRPECWVQCIDWLQAERGLGVLAGIVLLALVLTYLLTGLRTSEASEQYLAFKNHGTTVSILLRAVNEFVGKIGEEFAAIVSMKPRVHPRGRSIDIDLELRVKAGTQIPELCQLLQERVRESVSQSLGLSEIKRIRVQVKDIVGDPPPLDELPSEER